MSDSISAVSDREIPWLTDNAKTVLERRYLAREPGGDPIEDPLGLFERVAADIASAEVEFVANDADGRARCRFWEQRFLELLRSGDFLPNSPTLVNAGRALGQLSACFVLPVPDDMEGIFETLKHAALVHKTGGGTGFSFSDLRPAGDVVASTSGIASGPLSFIAVFDAATEQVRQGGVRRGANMAILDVSHPDICAFIDAKRSGSDQVTNFNLSVGVDDRFMRRAAAGERHELVNPRSGEVVATVDAAAVFEQICAAAWQTGDPGIIFTDRMNADRVNPTPALGRIEATNPCGEQPLLAYESCNLGSVNIARFVDAHANIDTERLSNTVDVAVRFLDNVIERSRYPVSEIAALTRHGNRKIGLGVMGWADALVGAGIAYDSEPALKLAEDVMCFVSAAADDASERLACERGSFNNWPGSYYDKIGRPMRNATRTTVAPAGTISIIAGASSGIEPLYALSYSRRALDGGMLDEVHEPLCREIDRHGLDRNSVLAASAATGGLRNVESVPADMRRVFVTAHEIAPEWHVRMQAAFQKHTDNAVSKTVNLGFDATVDDVVRVFTLADRLGCRGITVFRDASKPDQVLRTTPARFENCPDCAEPPPV